jgi:hypothetical protein|tara:strand:+ start:168 stop:395 length:228 start_codon:yes stop_codon:yes gene_type:complete
VIKLPTELEPYRLSEEQLIFSVLRGFSFMSISSWEKGKRYAHPNGVNLCGQVTLEKFQKIARIIIIWLKPLVGIR